MEPKLYYKDKSKLTSILGGIISLLIIVVMVIFTYISGKEIFDHNNPTVLLSSNYDVNPRQYNLTEKNFGLFVGMQDSSANYYIDDRVYDLVVLSRRRFTSKNQDNSLKIVSQTKKLDIEKCDLKKHFPNFQNLFSDQDLLNLNCINPKQLNELALKGSFDNEEYFSLSVRVFPCKNSTENSNKCKSIEEIDKKLNGGYFVINLLDTIFDHKNYTHPESKIRRNYFTSMSRKYYKELYFWMKNVDYITDRGIIDKDLFLDSLLLLNNIAENIDFRESDFFINVSIRLQYTREIYNKQYLKITDIIAKIGVLFKGIVLVVGFLYDNLRTINFNLNIFTDLYNIQDTYKKLVLNKKNLSKYFLFIYKYIQSKISIFLLIKIIIKIN